MTGEVGVTARLPEAAPAGQKLQITATDPPRFGPDGPAVPGRPAQSALAAARPQATSGRGTEARR